jgi:hypothetical protein
MRAFTDVSFSLYTTLIRSGAMGLSEDELQSVDEDSEAPRRVTEAASDLGTGASLNEEGAEGLVLAVGGVSGLDEDLGKVR